MAAYPPERMRAYMAERRARIRAELIALLGGRCAQCNSTNELEFDHIDPSAKLFTIASGLDSPRNELLAEVAKCQLLCKSHHLEKTRPELEGRHLAGEAQARGERHGNAKLKSNDIRNIRKSPLSNRETGQIYGVARSTIQAIRSGRSWKHVS